MDEALQDLLAKVSDVWHVGLYSIHDTNSMGENALHCVCVWGDLSAAKLLIDAGIDINKYGELGYTPLHLACGQGHPELVVLLVENGADLFARSEGNLPFTVARLSGNDSICDYLLPFMEKILAQDRHIYLKARIKQLKHETGRLEMELRSLTP